MAALVYASRMPECPFEVVLVTGDRPNATGLDLAEAEGVPVVRIPRPTPKDKSQFFAALELVIDQSGADYIVLAGFMRILPEEFVARWEGRILNIHPSLLPKYPGLDTHSRAIEAGDSHAGCTVHVVTAALDEGPILGQLAVAIATGETPETLAARVKLAEHQLYPRAVADYVSRWRDPAALLARVRALALALPETDERESHGSPGFRVGGDKTGKYFAYFADQHHGTPHIALLVRTGSMDELLALVEDQPEVYFKPAYYGASGWVGIILNRPGVDWDAVAAWLERSWRGAAPKRLTRLMDVADEF
ncbi:phosphoribosylglycinamide formyltransferase [Erythrobacter colymbi]|uniref:phosphoribosylglycinamide formyltransferase n=1 Tax=Erythrobacter colymbi TaxID=1161202 RepID=UPI000A3975E7